MKHKQIRTKDLGTGIYPADVKFDENWYLKILGFVSQDLVV